MENWLWQVALKKVAYAVAKGAIALLASSKLLPIIEAHGVHVDQAALSVALPTTLFGLLEAAHDWLKVKTGMSWL